jgi:DNA-binding transcriptional MocR family regulator
MRAHLSGPVFEQLAVCHLLEIADDVLPAHRQRLRTQRDALVTAVATAVPRWRVPVPPGGLVLRCDLGAPVSNAVVDAAERRGCGWPPGRGSVPVTLSLTGCGCPSHIRSRFCRHAAEILAEAADTLPQAALDRQPSRLVV